LRDDRACRQTLLHPGCRGCPTRGGGRSGSRVCWLPFWVPICSPSSSSVKFWPAVTRKLRGHDSALGSFVDR
jgi:hypothetical protein